MEPCLRAMRDVGTWLTANSYALFAVLGVSTPNAFHMSLIATDAPDAAELPQDVTGLFGGWRCIANSLGQGPPPAAAIAAAARTQVCTTEAGGPCTDATCRLIHLEHKTGEYALPARRRLSRTHRQDPGLIPYPTHLLFPLRLGACAGSPKAAPSCDGAAAAFRSHPSSVRLWLTPGLWPNRSPPAPPLAGPPPAPAPPLAGPPRTPAPPLAGPPPTQLTTPSGRWLPESLRPPPKLGSRTARLLTPSTCLMPHERIGSSGHRASVSAHPGGRPASPAPLRRRWALRANHAFSPPAAAAHGGHPCPVHYPLLSGRPLQGRGQPHCICRLALCMPWGWRALPRSPPTYTKGRKGPNMWSARGLMGRPTARPRGAGWAQARRLPRGLQSTYYNSRRVNRHVVSTARGRTPAATSKRLRTLRARRHARGLWLRSGRASPVGGGCIMRTPGSQTTLKVPLDSSRGRRK